MHEHWSLGECAPLVCHTQRAKDQAVLFRSTPAPLPWDPLPGEAVTLCAHHGLQVFVVAVLRGPPGHSTRCVCGVTSAGRSLPPVPVYKMQQQRVPTRPTG